MVVKNSLARRATEGTTLAPAFEGAKGSQAVVWGSEDVVSLAKEVMAIADGDDFEKFEPTGGVLDGDKLTAADVKSVSKWPSRTEMLSTLIGPDHGPGDDALRSVARPGEDAGQPDQAEVRGRRRVTLGERAVRRPQRKRNNDRQRRSLSSVAHRSSAKRRRPIIQGPGGPKPFSE